MTKSWEFSSRKLPLVNLNIIGTRPEPVVPHGVWIEVQPYAGKNEACENADVEQERSNLFNQQKSDRLKKFQRDVQKRVNRAAVIRRKDIANAQNDKMEQESKVLYRSASAAESSVPKRNSCLYNINHISIDCAGKISSVALSKEPEFEDNSFLDADSNIECRSQKLEILSTEARKKLANKLLTPKLSMYDSQKKKQEKSDLLLPGGIWGSGHTREKSKAEKDILSEHKHSNILDDEDNNPSSSDMVQTVPAVSAVDDIALASVHSGIWPGSSNATLQSCEKVMDLCSECNKVENEDGLIVTQSVSHVPNVVHFKLDDKEWKSKTTLSTTSKSPSVICHVPKSTVVGDADGMQRVADTVAYHDVNKITKAASTAAPPVIHPGLVALDERRSVERARWLCRRVFSDAERQRTREGTRIREHKQRVEKLKEKKEQERLKVETESRDQVEAIKVANDEAEKQLREEQSFRERGRKEKEKELQKVDRFVVAMKCRLQERVTQNNLELPPLCMCAESFWETDPNSCANNCLFYRNQPAYAKALETVVHALEKKLDAYQTDALQRSALSLSLVPGRNASPRPFAARRATRPQNAR